MGLNSPGLLGWGASSTAHDLPVRDAPRPQGFSGASFLARVLDASANGPTSSGALSELLRSGRARNLTDAISQLNPSERNELRRRWGRSLDELESLSHEGDSQLFYAGLLQVGQRLEDQDQLEQAGLVYSALAALASGGVAAGNSPRPPLILRGGEDGVRGEEVPPLRIRGGQEGLSPVPASIRDRAQNRLNAMTGVGASGERIAFLARRLATEATRPDMLLSMGAAGAAFRLTRFAAMSRLATSPGLRIFQEGFGLSAAANTAGFLGETIAFTGVGKVAGAALGHQQDWSPEAVFHEWAGGATMLLGLKVTGALAGAAAQRYARGGGALERFTQVALPQVGMFGGILLGNRLEELAGFRTRRQGDTWLVDGLSTLLQFNVSGRLMDGALGPGYARLNHELELRTEEIRHRPTRFSSLFPDLASYVEVLASGHRIATPEGVEFNDFGTTHDVRHISQTSGKSGEGGGRRRGEGRKTGSQTPPPSDTAPRTRRSRTISQFPPPPEAELSAPDSELEKPTEIFTPPSLTPPAPAAGSPPPTMQEDIGKAVTIGFPPELPAMTVGGPRSLREAEALGRAATQAVVVSGKGREGILPPPDAAEEPASLQGTVATMDPAEFDAAPGTAQIQLRTQFRSTYAPGTRLGPDGIYEIVEMVGKGGFGEVYKVLDRDLDRYDAIKILQDPTRMEEFQNEIRMTARLDARYAVKVLSNFRLETGQPVQVMEFLDGYSFEHLIRARFKGNPIILESGATLDMGDVMSLDNRYRMVAEMFHALDSAHEHGVIHRDIKPEHIQRRLNGQIQILDFGIGKFSNNIREDVRMSLPPGAEARASGRETQHGLISGTIGYIAPERGGLVTNPRSVDIYAMAIVAYEMMTGVQPFAKFRPGDPARGEPLRVLDRETDSHRTQIHQYASMLPEGLRPEPPTFREAMLGEIPEWVQELEPVIQRGLKSNPNERFSTLREMREAWLLAPVRAEYRNLRRAKDEMREVHERVVNPRWIAARDGLVLPNKGWEYLHGPVEELVQRDQSWKKGVSDLITKIAGIIGDEHSQGVWVEGHRMVAQLSWELLNEGGDYLSREVREDFIRQIQTHDRPLNPGDLPRISISLERPIALEFLGQDLRNGRQIEGPLLVKIVPFKREISPGGRETMNFIEDLSGTIEGYWGNLSKELRLPVGYYAVEFSHPEYAPMGVPLHLSYEDARRGVEIGRPFSRNLDFVPRLWVPEGFRVIQGGLAKIGQNFYQEQDLDTGPSYPMRDLSLDTMAITQDMITVGEFAEFIVDRINNGATLEELGRLLPRTTFAGTPKMGRRFKAMVGAIRRDETTVLGREEGYYWEIRSRGMGKKRTLRLVDPTSMPDPFNDPIYMEQPVSAILYHAALRFAEWKFNGDKLNYPISDFGNYALPRIDEKEAIDRNFFPWNFPWGYKFNPSCVTCRTAFPPNAEHKPLQRVGTHPSGTLVRDRTIFGTRDNLGNARESTSTEGEEANTILISGGSIRHTNGAPFRPTSRTYMSKEGILDMYGAFRLVLRYPRPK